MIKSVHQNNFILTTQATLISDTEKSEGLSLQQIAENEEKNAELVEQSCADIISFMGSIFKHLSLKGNKLEVFQPIK